METCYIVLGIFYDDTEESIRVFLDRKKANEYAAILTMDRLSKLEIKPSEYKNFRIKPVDFVK